MSVPDKNFNPMDHFEDTFGQNFGQKRGSEVETNSAVSFVSDMLDIKGKCDARMYSFDAYRRTKSTFQEHNGVKNWKPRRILITIAELPDERDNLQDEIQMKQSFQNGENPDFTVKANSKYDNSVPGRENVDSHNNLMERIYVTARFS